MYLSIGITTYTRKLISNLNICNDNNVTSYLTKLSRYWFQHTYNSSTNYKFMVTYLNFHFFINLFHYLYYTDIATKKYEAFWEKNIQSLIKFKIKSLIRHLLSLLGRDVRRSDHSDRLQSYIFFVYFVIRNLRTFLSYLFTIPMPKQIWKESSRSDTR